MWACVKAERLQFLTLIVTFDTAHSSDGYAVYLKDLTVLFIGQHKLWNNVYLRIAVIIASAGTLL